MMEWLNDWMMEWWNDGMMEWWNDGMMEWWNDGIMEWWNDDDDDKESMGWPYDSFDCLLYKGTLLYVGVWCGIFCVCYLDNFGYVAYTWVWLSMFTCDLVC